MPFIEKALIVGHLVRFYQNSIYLADTIYRPIMKVNSYYS